MRPAARVGDGGFKGTGTSQATAVVAGIAALMFDARPSLTPNEAKATLVGTASTDLAGRPCAGAGLVHAGRAVQAAAGGTFDGADPHASVQRSSGLGSIDGTRGSHKPYTDLNGDGVAEQVSGEHDTLGNMGEGTVGVEAVGSRHVGRLAVGTGDHRDARMAGRSGAGRHVVRRRLGRAVMVGEVLAGCDLGARHLDRQVVARRGLEHHRRPLSDPG